MKIAIAGQMASGKTTLANSLVEKGYTKVSLASKVKEIARDLFHMEVKDRPLLQKIGMKMREIRPSVWIDYIINLDDDLLVIDDVRFINEATALKAAGWTVVRLDITESLQKERLQNTYEDWEVHWNNRQDPSETEVSQIRSEDVDLELMAGPDAIEQLFNHLKI